MLPKNKVPSQYDTIRDNNGTRQFTFNIGAGWHCFPRFLLW
jgi:hypothetical protein